jgi:hypothetical protein
MKNGMKFRENTTTAQKELQDISESTQATPFLPLVHVTSAASARDILLSGQIIQKQCKVFKKDLVYSFIARPDYHLKDGDEEQSAISYFPCAFILNPHKIPPPKHVYPFDTGAGFSGYFNSSHDKYVLLDDYQLKPTLEAAHKHIAFFFDSNDNYLTGDFKHEIEKTTPSHQTTILSYLKIMESGVQMRHANFPDTRSKAVEVSFDSHIDVKAHVEAVVLPKQLLEDLGVKNQALLNAIPFGVDILDYNWESNRKPDDFMATLRQLAYDYYKAKGYM